ncbi:hypothetical protein BSNK01_24740 [Bacillaceae bacterium]
MRSQTVSLCKQGPPFGNGFFSLLPINTIIDEIDCCKTIYWSRNERYDTMERAGEYDIDFQACLPFTNNPKYSIINIK